MSKMKSEGSPFGFEPPLPGRPDSPQKSVDLKVQKASKGGSLDPIVGAPLYNSVPVSSEPNSPVKGDGFSNKKASARGEGHRGSVSYG